jgi:hypothetical protein
LNEISLRFFTSAVCRFGTTKGGLAPKRSSLARACLEACEKNQKPHLRAMTTTHIREQIDAMSDEDRFFASAYLQHLSHEAVSERKATLAARMTHMDEGHKFTLDQLVDVHQQLERQGL